MIEAMQQNSSLKHRVLWSAHSPKGVTGVTISLNRKEFVFTKRVKQQFSKLTR